jgi:exopolysaccharide biosynthesis polyprenyl glycosylphosphotransferase
MFVVLLSFFFDSSLVVSRGWIVLSWLLLTLCVSVNRFVARRAVYRLRRAGRLGTRVIIVGASEDATDLAERIRETPASGLQVVGVYHPEAVIARHDDTTDESTLERLISTERADAVVISAASVPQFALSTIVRELADSDAELQLVPGMYEILTTGVKVREIQGLPLVTMNKVRITGFDLLLKTALDLVVAALAFVILLPLLIIIGAAVRLTSPGPVFHRRRVVGQGGRRFYALKFRSMYVNGDEILGRYAGLAETLADSGKLVDDPRVTPIGRWLRRWSLDELPQLVNVLQGQMSLVGPRMISEDELDHFGHWRENLITVKPGLTGLWQVSGRSQLGYTDRVRLDMHYIRRYSIWVDLEILLRTVPAVWRGTGAY